MAEKYVRLVQDIYENSTTVMRCVVGRTDDLQVEVGLHQGLALSPFFILVFRNNCSEQRRLWKRGEE